MRIAAFWRLAIRAIRDSNNPAPNGSAWWCNDDAMIPCSACVAALPDLSPETAEQANPSRRCVFCGTSPATQGRWCRSRGPCARPSSAEVTIQAHRRAHPGDRPCPGWDEADSQVRRAREGKGGRTELRNADRRTRKRRPKKRQKLWTALACMEEGEAARHGGASGAGPAGFGPAGFARREIPPGAGDAPAGPTGRPQGHADGRPERRRGDSMRRLVRH